MTAEWESRPQAKTHATKNRKHATYYPNMCTIRLARKLSNSAIDMSP